MNIGHIMKEKKMKDMKKTEQQAHAQVNFARTSKSARPQQSNGTLRYPPPQKIFCIS